jgi:hypothetical protein
VQGVLVEDVDAVGFEPVEVVHAPTVATNLNNVQYAFERCST